MSSEPRPITEAPSRSYPRFSDAEFHRRRAVVRAIMEERGVDAIVAYGHGMSRGAVQYLSNWPVTVEAYLVFSAEGESSLFVQFNNHTELAQLVSVTTHTDYVGPDHVQTVHDELRRLGVDRGTIGLAGPMPGWAFTRLVKALGGGSLVPFDDAFQSLWFVKSQEELEWLRHAAQLADRSMEALERELQPGLTEYDIAAIVQGAYLPHGGRNLIHFIGSTSMHEPDICAPLQYESGRTLRRGDVVLTEISVDHWGYASQALRPFTIGEPPTAEYQELYDVAHAAFESVASVLRAGATPEDVVAAADLIEEAGYTIYDGLVHGMGLGYLPPSVRTRGTTLKPPPAGFRYPADSTWVIQPNVVTRDLRMGVQVGELVLVTEAGVERIHSYPMRFTICG